MIGHLRGRVQALGEDWTILDVSGVGYRLWLPLSTRTGLPGRGEEVSLHVHTHVREDAILLYGFETEVERDLFESLIEVSGVGPRLALSILSSLTPGELERAVRLGDLDVLRRISGVGKRTAERLVVELKDRLSAFRSTDPGPRQELESELGGVASAAESHVSRGFPDGVSEAQRAEWIDAREALLVLGYSPEEAEEALSRAAAAVPPSEPPTGRPAEGTRSGAQWWVRQALAQLDGHNRATRSV